MQTINSSAWRFLDKQSGTIEYGLNNESTKFESTRFLAMNRILESNHRGGELFAGDILTVNNQDARYIAYLDGTLIEAGGARRVLELSDTYQIVGQMPDGWPESPR